jgi:S-DNA-T family DNA segregation ATPase FtsK/SpoIIIE
METLVTKGRYHNIYFVAEIGLNKFSEVRGYRVFEAFVEYRTGMHFGGKSNDNTIMPFEYMTFSEQSASDPIGVGRLPGSSTYKGTSKVVIPLARK